MSQFTTKLWTWGRKLASSIIDDVNEVFNFLGISQAVSFIASLPDNIINNTTHTDLSVLKNDYSIAAPVDQDLDKTPTVSQFLNAANTEYSINGYPDGMTPFLVDGKQLAIQNKISGMAAKVWVTDQKQVIIAFQGTGGGDNLIINPLMTISQVASDIQVWNQEVSVAEKDALNFTKYVVHQAQLQGYSTNDVFLTGHSLGGIEASYVAQQTGLAGMAFESTGIPESATAKGNGDNFISLVTYGDPVGEYASDTQGQSPFVTSMTPGSEGKFNHYGQVVFVGDKADSAAMQGKLDDWNANSFKNVFSLLDVIPDFLRFHLPGTQAADIGAKLDPYSLLYDTIVTQHGAVVPIANDTLAQVRDDVLQLSGLQY
ncbi:lipase [Commensalibacter oyaizuii]|uniref:Lipase n=1 Tax=Commensalibacter oyaizuii TaxID=3043873 RepID=A0ABT6Q1F6_9PROT|nr:lipase [Commensalibacter sp. TBRC 16381]MDI2090935.1 lipase [Commensalibacter sp. TBRC 16381]